MNKPGLVVFFCILFSLYLFPQEFIPSSVMLLDSGDIDGIGDLNREKLMPYHIDAIKKNGISKEIHKKNGKVINNYYYSSDGLLIKSEGFNSESKTWPSTEFFFSKKNLLIISVWCMEGWCHSIEYLRDSIGRIEGIKSKEYRNNSHGDIESIKSREFQIRYIYTGGILEKVGPYVKEPKEPLYKGGGWTFSFDPYGRGIEGGEGDGGWHVTFNKSGKLATIVWEFYGMASKTEIVKTIAYKNDLMNRITEVETTKITDWNGAKISKEKPGYKKTITTITYEYGYKKKK